MGEVLFYCCDFQGMLHVLEPKFPRFLPNRGRRQSTFDKESMMSENKERIQVLCACYEWIYTDGTREGGALCVEHKKQVEALPQFDHYYTVDPMHPRPWCDYCHAEQRAKQMKLFAATESRLTVEDQSGQHFELERSDEGRWKCQRCARYLCDHALFVQQQTPHISSKSTTSSNNEQDKLPHLSDQRRKSID